MMKYPLSLTIRAARRNAAKTIGFSALAMLTLSSCGGGSDARYRVGGAIQGLMSSGLVLAMGVDVMSPAANASSFKFTSTLPSGATYSVSIAAQPAGQTCSIGAGTGSGTVGVADISSIQIQCLSAWIWQAGATAAAAGSSYGSQGVAGAGNSPGARDGASVWTDSSGSFWLFGGEGHDSSGAIAPLGDLWEYSSGSGLWTWQGGATQSSTAGTYGTKGTAAAGYIPGTRYAAASWTDASGNFWLFGGHGDDSAGTSGELADLWKYTPATGLWTWVGGSSTVVTTSTYGTQGTGSTANIPGGRDYAATWTDSSGNLWLFGGYGYDSTGAESQLNDLWEYTPSNGEWTWVAGSDTAGASGVYGAATGNVPGAREGAQTWIDSSGNLWLFGGYGYDSAGTSGYLSDLWEYTSAANSKGAWTFVSGSKTEGASTTYGTEGTSSSGAQPGGREIAATWIDSAGDLWLLGGSGESSSASVGYLNDLWEYSPSTQAWTWMSGGDGLNSSGVYGTEATDSVGSLPGGRAGAAAFTDSGGHFWVFGGYGDDSTGATGDMNDLWEYAPP
jgi:N-acetylneuraminic acid mutarotase